MSNYEATGRIQEIFDKQSGVSKAGKEWKKREFLVETEDQYPKKICFNLFGDNIDFMDNLKTGDLVKVLFDVESREFNGRWYHNVNAFNVQSLEEETSNSQSPEDLPEEYNAPEEEDDLPF
ncbi:DUF3127 domain-containing protein [Sunxiuqinia indica]|uniref:DUF3127 domain-containing protein n=1 Tax=Sunxiuqinia indica TaxID=2692584 RepID=UPI001359E90A|nr:DUF3127 domain-containing protein [Sunxiuqinia indica]